MTLGERIRRWRMSREGMTRGVLADLVGVSRQAVSYWERGLWMPTHANLGKIAAAIGVSLPVFWGPLPEQAPIRRAA